MSPATVVKSFRSLSDFQREALAPGTIGTHIAISQLGSLRRDIVGWARARTDSTIERPSMRLSSVKSSHAAAPPVAGHLSVEKVSLHQVSLPQM